MAHPYHHALSSVRKWGGTVDDYMEVHSWFDRSKEIIATFQHRALRHHAEGVYACEAVFGRTLTLSSGRIIPTRWVGEQHVKEDLGFIPSFADWARSIQPEPWMGRTQRIEREVEPLPTVPEPLPDASYALLGVSPEVEDLAVLRAAVRFFHPGIRRERGFRHARKRFYRQMLSEHAAVRQRFARSASTHAIAAE